MALPETVRVRLSSEAAGAISITPVVVRDMPLRELIDAMLPTVGKDAARIREMLLRGTLVSGASRFRWQGWRAEPSEVDHLLAGFPDPDPARPFAGVRCLSAVLEHAGGRIEIPREAGSRRRFLRRESFWDAVLSIADPARIEYAGYSYRDHADRYRVLLGPAESARLRDRAERLVYSTLKAQVRRLPVHCIEFLVARE